MDKPEAYARALIEFSENIQKAEDKYAQQVGAISLEWNELHFLFYVCFQSLLKINDAEAKSLWESGSSDRQQRNMLRAIIGLMKRKANQKILIDGLRAYAQLSRMTEAARWMPPRKFEAVLS